LVITPKRCPVVPWWPSQWAGGRFPRSSARQRLRVLPVATGLSRSTRAELPAPPAHRQPSPGSAVDVPTGRRRTFVVSVVWRGRVTQAGRCCHVKDMSLTSGPSNRWGLTSSTQHNRSEGKRRPRLQHAWQRPSSVRSLRLWSGPVRNQRGPSLRGAQRRRSSFLGSAASPMTFRSCQRRSARFSTHVAAMTLDSASSTSAADPASWLAPQPDRRIAS